MKNKLLKQIKKEGKAYYQCEECLMIANININHAEMECGLIIPLNTEMKCPNCNKKTNWKITSHN